MSQMTDAEDRRIPCPWCNGNGVEICGHDEWLRPIWLPCCECKGNGEVAEVVLQIEETQK